MEETTQLNLNNGNIKKIKSRIIILNFIFYISFLFVNQDKKYDILYIFLGVTILMITLSIFNTKTICLKIFITKSMFLISILFYCFIIYLCSDDLYHLFPYIFLYSIIVLLHYMLNKEVNSLINYITISYRNYVVYNLVDKECPVCLELFNSGYIYTCNHFICENCFNNWIKVSHDIKCVMCRTGTIIDGTNSYV